MTDQSPSNNACGGDAFLKAFLPGLILGLVLGGLVGAVVVPLLSNNAPKPIGNGEIIGRQDAGPRERGEQPGGELIDPDSDQDLDANPETDPNADPDDEGPDDDGTGTEPANDPG